MLVGGWGGPTPASPQTRQPGSIVDVYPTIWATGQKAKAPWLNQSMYKLFIIKNYSSKFIQSGAKLIKLFRKTFIIKHPTRLRIFSIVLIFSTDLFKSRLGTSITMYHYLKNNF